MDRSHFRRGGLAAVVACGALATAHPAGAAPNAGYLCLDAPSSEQLKDVDATIAACTALIEQGGKNGAHLSGAYFHRAMMYGVKRDPQQALEDNTRVLELSPNDPIALTNRGSDKLALRDPDGAIADYTAAIKAAPRFAFAFYQRGQVYEDQEKWFEAHADYEKAIELEPDLSQGLAGACRVLAIQNRELASADHMCERAMHFTVNTFFAYYSRSLVRLREGRAADALSDAQTAVRLRPDSADALFVVGLCEQRLGRPDDAQADMQRAKAMDGAVEARFTRWGFVSAGA
jgi:tetratricopeptide (TPR) repeat protein